MRIVSPLEQFDVLNLWIIYIGPYNFNISLTNTILPLLLLLWLYVYYIWIMNWNHSIIPTSWQLLVETLYIFVFNIINQQSGVNGNNYLPLVYSLFIWILISNLLSMIPFGIALTSHLIIILLVSVTLCTSIFVVGLLQYNLNFLNIFIPESPILLLPILIPIEIFSYLISLFSLAIRLSANILAGHTLVYIISSFILNMTIVNTLLYVFLVIPLFAILSLEFGVAFLQAYVFSILFCIYLSDAVNGPSH